MRGAPSHAVARRRARGSARAIAALVCLLAPAAAVTPVGAQTPAQRTPALRATVELTTIRVGDPVTIRLEAALAPGARPIDRAPHLHDTLPDGARLLHVDTLAAARVHPGRLKGRARLVFLRTGVQPIPAFTLAYRTGAGGTDSVVSAPARVEVTSVLPNTNQAIKDIKDLERASRWVQRAVLAAVVLAFAAIALLLARRALRKRAPAPVAETAAEPLSPLARALGALDDIETSCRAGRGDPAALHAAAADVVRRWLAESLALPALERTTPELVELVAAATDDPAVADAVRALLDEADLVKFADVRPRAGDVLRSVTRARRLLMEWPAALAAPELAAAGGADALR